MYLLMYGYGELIESNKKILESNNEIIKILAKNIIQKASPKNAVQTNVEGLIIGHTEHKKDDNSATIPQIPIVAFPKPCKNVFLLSFFSAITSCFV